MKLVSAIIFLALCILGCETEYYKLDVSTSGNGVYEITPEKSEYEEGESVTIAAFADSGWKFRRWDGSTLSSKSNPLSLVMDGHKNIRLVFGIPVEPDLTGTWESEQWLITFEIEQPDLFEKDLKGKMIVQTIYNTTLVYDVLGINRNPRIDMNCTKSGYYEIVFYGQLVNSNRIDGSLREAGEYYDCDLVRVNDSPSSREKQPFVVHQIQEDKQ